VSVSDADFKKLRDRAAAMDARRARQISNQIAAINRLLKDGSYEGEMKAVQELLATTGAELDEALDQLEAVRKWRERLDPDYAGWAFVDDFDAIVKPRQGTDGA
jgi:DNA-binding FrmR family transcriptional regulator